MPTTRFRRQFSAGSRPAPDPYDKFLDLEGFYRKHTARDASCLFRAISEQMYDTQGFHELIRKDSVNYLIKHRDQYEHETPIDFDEYTFRMAKSTTYGTFLELRAIGYMYKRNILLYQPYDLGMWLVKEPEYTENFRIFFAPEKHFDSVFTKPFIVKAAFCQSICYEILYKNVFRLPDVEYSVETMLHGVTDGYTTENNGNDSHVNHIVLGDGRKFQLDKPEDTLCILENASLCHFHNPDFEVISEQIDKCSNPHDAINMQRMMNASLPDKYISCVRQLLNEGITPFPYKVAKALDPDIYRNIEFDSWSDMRKEALAQSWYKGDWNFQVGVKCLVKLNESKDDLLKCHIQEMSPNKGPCVVFVEALAEKHSVSYSCLQPIKDAKPWTLPLRYKRDSASVLTAYDFDRKNGERHQSFYNRKQCTHKKQKKYADIAPEFINSRKSLDSHLRNADEISDFESYIGLSHFQPYSVDLVAMPLNTFYRSNNNNNNNGSNSKSNTNHNQNPKGQNSQQQKNGRSGQPTLKPTENSVQLLKRDMEPEKDFQPNEHQQAVTPLHEPNGFDNQTDMSVPPPPMPVHYTNTAGFVQYYYPGPECVDLNYYNVPADVVTSPSLYQVPPYVGNPIATPVANPYAVSPTLPAHQQLYPMPMATWPNNPGMSPATYYVSAPNAQLAVGIQTPTALTICHRELLRTHGRINLNPSPSLSPVGSDLPMNDKPTIRFFYNMGIEFFKNLEMNYGKENVLSMVQNVNGYTETSSVDYDGSVHLSTDFPSIAYDTNESEVPSTPNRERSRFNESYYPGPTSSQNRRPNINPSTYRKDNSKQNHKPHQRHYNNNSYASNGAKPPMNKNGVKQQPNHHNGSRSFDSTPTKDSTARTQQYYESNNINTDNYYPANGNTPVHRDAIYATPETSSTLLAPTHSPYMSAHMPFVPFDGHVERPIYMPANVFPTSGYSQMLAPPHPNHGPIPITSPCDQDIVESFTNSPVACYNAPPYGFAPNYWCQTPLPAQNHLVPPPQASLNSSNVSSSSSNANSAVASNSSN